MLFRSAIYRRRRRASVGSGRTVGDESDAIGRRARRSRQKMGSVRRPQHSEGWQHSGTGEVRYVAKKPEEELVDDPGSSKPDPESGRRLSRERPRTPGGRRLDDRSYYAAWYAKGRKESQPNGVMIEREIPAENELQWPSWRSHQHPRLQ